MRQWRKYKQRDRENSSLPFSLPIPHNKIAKRRRFLLKKTESFTHLVWKKILLNFPEIYLFFAQYIHFKSFYVFLNKKCDVQFFLQYARYKKKIFFQRRSFNMLYFFFFRHDCYLLRLLLCRTGDTLQHLHEKHARHVERHET